MNNFEQLKSMSLDQFVEWLDENVSFDCSPWWDWFDDKYCKNCEIIMCHYESYIPRLHPTSWCELHNNKCKFFPDMDEAPDNKEIIKLWLESEVAK